MNPTQNDFEEVFRGAGIDYSKPGFYDDQKFVEIEKSNPAFLEIYADYINSMSFPSDYLMNARDITLDITKFIYDKLSLDGLKGACLDVCGIICRFLEKKGIWNYIVKGGLTISFDKSTSISKTYCAPNMTYDNPAVLGHAWVVAPPFRIIDVAFSYQHYTCGERTYLKGFVAEENVNEATLQVEDLIDMDAIELFVKQRRRRPRIQDMEMVSPGLIQRIHKYGIFQVELTKATLKYTSCGVTVFDAPLEQVKNIELSGKYPVDLYKEFLSTKQNDSM